MACQMRRARCGGALLALALAAACSSLQTGADWDRAANFADLHSWRWISAQPGADDGDARAQNPLLHRRLQSAIASELERRGYRELPADERGEPDFWVAYHVGVDQKIDVDTAYRGYASMPYRGVYGSQTYVREYDVGTLLIDVIRRPLQEEVIWRGWAQARLQSDGDVDPAEREQRASEAVTRVLERFPPKSGDQPKQQP